MKINENRNGFEVQISKIVYGGSLFCAHLNSNTDAKIIYEKYWHHRFQNTACHSFVTEICGVMFYIQLLVYCQISKEVKYFTVPGVQQELYQVSKENGKLLYTR